MKRLKISLYSRGDPIIEVLLSIAILGLVLAGAYALANRNLSSGVSAGWRDQALTSAQSQIEHIINAQNTRGCLLVFLLTKNVRSRSTNGYSSKVITTLTLATSSFARG